VKSNLTWQRWKWCWAGGKERQWNIERSKRKGTRDKTALRGDEKPKAREAWRNAQAEMETKRGQNGDLVCSGVGEGEASPFCTRVPSVVAGSAGRWINSWGCGRRPAWGTGVHMWSLAKGESLRGLLSRWPQFSIYFLTERVHVRHFVHRRFINPFINQLNASINSLRPTFWLLNVGIQNGPISTSLTSIPSLSIRFSVVSEWRVSFATNRNDLYCILKLNKVFIWVLFCT
jgi:hypothetical protein